MRIYLLLLLFVQSVYSYADNLLTLNSDNSVTITVPQTGLYILNVRYDDETYSKKIYVK